MRSDARGNDLQRNFNPPDGAAAEAAAALGPMPEWNLADLYPSPTAPEIARDLAAAAAEARRIKEAYHGKLVGLAADGAVLALAIEEFERFVELMGRLGSYAGLYYAGNQADPERAKFYGDVSEKLTAISTEIIFFDLELNQIDEAVMAQALKNPRLARYKPWIDNVRKEKPYQLEEKLERLFHEKGQTSGSAFNRLFNETIAALRFPVAGEPEPLALEMTLNLLSSPDEKKRGAAADALAKVFKDNVRLFTLITNTLAKDKEISDRWRGFKDVADSRHLANQVEAEVVDALVSSVRAAYPRLSHRYYAMKAKWLGKERLSHWDRNAPLPERPERTFAWNDAQRLVLGAYNDFAPEMSAVAGEFFDKQLDRCAGASRQGARRLRRGDRAVGASVRAAQLPRQAARRDDARPRAGPRRPPDAGAAARRAAGADAADARRDGLRVRRDADLQGAAEGDARCRRSARRSSPARSRICSTPWCGRSRSTLSSASCTRRAGRAS